MEMLPRVEHRPRESKATLVLAIASSQRCFPTEFKGSKVTETARVPAEIESQRCYRGSEHHPRESKAARGLAIASSWRCFPTEFKGSKVTETACVPAKIGTQRCYWGGSTVPKGEQSCPCTSLVGSTSLIGSSWRRFPSSAKTQR